MSAAPPYFLVLLRRWGAPWVPCDDFDLDNVVDLLAVVGMTMPMLSYIFATFLSLYVATLMTWGFAMSLMLNELLMFLTALVIPDVSVAEPACVVDEHDRPCHEAAVAMCTFVYFAAHLAEFRLFRTVRERGFNLSLPVYLALSVWGPAHLPSFTTEQVASGVAMGAISGMLGVTLLHRVILRHRSSPRIRWLLRKTGVEVDGFYNAKYAGRRDKLTIEGERGAIPLQPRSRRQQLHDYGAAPPPPPLATRAAPFPARMRDEL